MYLDKFRLPGRTALVTGGASGIGYCVVEALAEAGANVTIADLNRRDIDAAVLKLAEKGLAVSGVVMDVTDSPTIWSAGMAAWTSWSTTPASPAAKSPPKTWRTSAG